MILVCGALFKRNPVLILCVLYCSLTVQKEGPNKGRQFYGCPAPRGQGCNFFQWADEPSGGGFNSGIGGS